jgi:hypothetical protein
MINKKPKIDVDLDSTSVEEVPFGGEAVRASDFLGRERILYIE